MSKAEGQVVIVGAGQAGLQAAETLRAGGYQGNIILLGDEPYGPYHRPPLSKAWLAGEMDAAQLVMRAPEALARKNIELRTSVKVSAIDTAKRNVRLAEGSTLHYTGLVLATGSTPRALNVPGAGADGVLALRSRDDASAILRHLQNCGEKNVPVVVIGGGFIGLEVAATARKRGLAVTVLEAAPRLLGRVLAPVLSDWYAQLHTAHGVSVLLNAQLSSVESKDGQVVAAITTDGRRFPAGLVVVGIGVCANDALARAAGIECDRGIVVDACGRTSVAGVVAAGDCTARRLPDGSLLRLESVQNATEQGRSAAAALLGQERPFVATPWFWSDQYDKKLQMAGLSFGSDEWAVRGTLDAGIFSVCHFHRGKLIAVDSVNDSKTHLLARKLLDAGVSPAPAQAADTAFDLAGLLAK
ncbi:MAG TPA: FAD-dependent oxidoreductase [Gallionellaceae bacterium]|nr:FAD-dependent oxidoreductase [Gallionellaceae bacterium]